ncbi:MAG: RpiB/LacA/LacB family sugar-phosphate isomerase [Patescibacteria group bacterium]
MIHIASDYAGFKLKESLTRYLERCGIPYVDHGCRAGGKHNDFPDFALPVAQLVSTSTSSYGILICGTGFGMCVAANRFRHVRATLAFSPRQARFAKTHDNSNVLCLSAWETNGTAAQKIVAAWLATPFQPLARRRRRLNALDTWPK